MKSIRFTLLSSLALALLGPCFGTGTAYAQGLTGKFTLPFAAHWGQATLPAGDYAFKLAHAPQGVLNLYRDSKPVALIYAQSFAEKKSGREVLLVSQVNDTPTIREMALPSAGMVFYYAPAKAKRGTALEERGIGMAIPISITTGR